MEARLSQKEKELVAVGASVAAGCVPCTQYHVRAVQAAGATTDEVTRAVNVADCVKAGARGIMARVANEALGLAADTEPSCCADPTDRMTALVSIGAVVAANCPTLLSRYVEAGRSVGIRDDETDLVIRIAQMVRAKATEKTDEAAALIAPATARAEAQSCCGA
jgi:AhpD family alkylhydroperoxidase